MTEPAPALCQPGSVSSRSRDTAFGSGGAELAEARVDLVAITQKTRWFADRAAGAQLMAVVKADAFGYGMLPVAATALDAGATWARRCPQGGGKLLSSGRPAALGCDRADHPPAVGDETAAA